MTQERDGWGGKVIDRLAADLLAEFPEMKGLSVRNLEYMRQFAASWPDGQIPPQPVAQLPWGHVRCMLDKVDDRAERVPEELGDQLPALEEISAGVQRIVERHSDEVAEAEANDVAD